MHKLNDLPDTYAVIDLTTGTVLGTNLMLVRMPDDEDEAEEILTNETAAFNFGRETGTELFVLSDLDG